MGGHAQSSRAPSSNTQHSAPVSHALHPANILTSASQPASYALHPANILTSASQPASHAFHPVNILTSDSQPTYSHQPHNQLAIALHPCQQASISLYVLRSAGMSSSAQPLFLHGRFSAKFLAFKKFRLYTAIIMHSMNF